MSEKALVQISSPIKPGDNHLVVISANSPQDIESATMILRESLELSNVMATVVQTLKGTGNPSTTPTPVPTIEGGAVGMIQQHLGGQVIGVETPTQAPTPAPVPVAYAPSPSNVVAMPQNANCIACNKPNTCQTDLPDGLGGMRKCGQPTQLKKLKSWNGHVCASGDQSHKSAWCKSPMPAAFAPAFPGIDLNYA